MPTLYAGYNTSDALSTFLSGTIIGWVVMLTVLPAMMCLVFALGDAIYRGERPKEMQIANWIDVLRLKTHSAALWWQVVFLVLCYFGISRGAGIFSSYMHLAYLGDYLTAGGNAPPSINAYFPALGEFIQEAMGVLFILVFLVILLVWWRVIGNAVLMILCAFLVLIFHFVVSPAQDFYHAGILLVTRIPIWLITAFLILKYIRFNLLFYAVMGWCSIVFVGIRYLECDPTAFQTNGVLMILFGLAPLILALLAWHKERTTS